MFNRKKKRGFTLVEMLVVITIMALILGISIGSFSGMGNSTRISASFEELASAVRYARMYAIGNNQKTYLVFFGKGTESAESVFYPEPRDWYKYYRGYTAYAAVGQTKIMEDRLLPPGLLFDDSVGDPSGGNGVNIMSSNLGQIDIRDFKGAGTGTVTLRGVAFMPDGTIQYDKKKDSLDPALIMFTEGFTNADEKVSAFGKGNAGSIKIDKVYEKTRSHYTLRINPLAGNIEHREYIAK